MCLKVMLVDDEPFILKGLTMLIDWEKEDCEIVKTAANGQEAYEYLKENPGEGLDLILTDVEMPGMSGLTLLEKVKKEKLSDACFAILSGYNEFAYAQKAIACSCMEYILKPVSRDSLLSLIQKVGVKRDSIRKSGSGFLRPLKQAQVSRTLFNGVKDSTPERRNVLCKRSLDRLLTAVEQNRVSEIHKSVEELFEEMRASGFSEDLISMNINYLLFQMIHLAVEQDESVDQEEVLLYILKNVSEEGLEKGSTMHLKRFACEYAEYLVQLRNKVSRGVLLLVEKEVQMHYAQNLTLKDLSRTYFVNSSYLGQIFRKKYGQSFKDYLNAYRIKQAAAELVRTDKKISAVAEDVGYHDTDYFIRKFIEIHGCTPAKYRKNARQMPGENIEKERAVL